MMASACCLPLASPLLLSEADEEVAALYEHARSSPCPAVVILHNINKQSNIGGIVRSAIALGLSHCCLVGAVRPVTRSCHYNVRINKPARVPYQHLTAAQLNLSFHDKPQLRFSRFPSFASCHATLRALDYTLVAIEISPTSVSTSSARFPRRSALLLGNENRGIAPELLQLSSLTVRIPQWGEASLNVSAAATIVIYEYMQQWAGPESQRNGSKYARNEAAANEQQPVDQNAEPGEEASLDGLLLDHEHG